VPSVHERAKPVIDAMLALGHHVLADEAQDDQQSTWLAVGPLCVQVHPTSGYGLYLDGDVYANRPDEGYPFEKIEILLGRMRGLLGKTA
jgi:hypothetical protein